MTLSSAKTRLLSKLRGFYSAAGADVQKEFKKLRLSAVRSAAATSRLIGKLSCISSFHGLRLNDGRWRAMKKTSCSLEICSEPPTVHNPNIYCQDWRRKAGNPDDWGAEHFGKWTNWLIVAVLAKTNWITDQWNVCKIRRNFLMTLERNVPTRRERSSSWKRQN